MPRENSDSLANAGGLSQGKDIWSGPAVLTGLAQSLECHHGDLVDAPKTSHELGHRSPDTLYAHYRNLATREEGLAYFKIRPI